MIRNVKFGGRDRHWQLLPSLVLAGSNTSAKVVCRQCSSLLSLPTNQVQISSPEFPVEKIQKNREKKRKLAKFGLFYPSNKSSLFNTRTATASLRCIGRPWRMKPSPCGGIQDTGYSPYSQPIPRNGSFFGGSICSFEGFAVFHCISIYLVVHLFHIISYYVLV